MGNENQIKGLNGANLPSIPGAAKKSGEVHSAPQSELPKRENPKQNAPLLFDKKWQNAQAKDLKHNLTTIISGGDKKQSAENHRGNPAQTKAHSSGEKPLPNAPSQPSQANKHQTNEAKNANTHLTEQAKNSSAHLTEQAKNLNTRPTTEQAKNSSAHLTEQTKNLIKHQPEHTRDLNTHRSEQPKTLNTYLPEQAKSLNKHQPEQAKNLLNQTWDSLVNTAKEHRDLATFRDKPKQFWDNVRQMSEIRVVETYVNGKSEPRAVSRYGELFRQMERHGGRLETFLATLPPGERNVFEARYQINRTFGADNLFVGSGIALDRRGDFPVRVFLSQNGKNVELPPHAIISLLNGKNVEISPRSIMNLLNGKNLNSSLPQTISGAPGGDFFGEGIALPENAAIFTNGAVLLNAKSAALLSLSLALYQNIQVMLPLTDVAAEIVPQNQPDDFMPKALNLPNDRLKARASNQAAFENANRSENVLKRTNEGNVAGALINGALTTIDEYRKSRYQAEAPAKIDSTNIGFGFSAGATGAMMGATVGCIVPLAEKSVGEVLGFAASVVVGLTDSGLRSLGVNTLVSVITTGAQIFLTASTSGIQKNAPGESDQKVLNAAGAATFFEEDLRQTIFNRRAASLLSS